MLMWEKVKCIGILGTVGMAVGRAMGGERVEILRECYRMKLYVGYCG